MKRRLEDRAALSPEDPAEGRAAGALGKIFSAALLALPLYLFVLQSVTVEGASMEPRLTESDRLFVNRLGTLLGRAPERFDVVVAENPAVPGTSMVKRVVGRPGERIRVDEAGRLFVNGRAVEDPYRATATGIRRSRPVEVALGPDEYFLLGDNREFSTDSRELGPVRADAIHGVVALRYWPLSAIGTVGDGDGASR